VLTRDASPNGLCPSCLFAEALSLAPDLEPAGEIEPEELSQGAVLGPFLIEGVLGNGGMSTVYRAREVALDRVVALKVLPPAFLHDPTFARRFQHEARIVAGLEHPRIVPLYASGIEGASRG
jgi:serine/threonine-protein kinase